MKTVPSHHTTYAGGNYKRSDSPDFSDVPTSLKNVVDENVSNYNQSEDTSADGASAKVSNMGTAPGIKVEDLLEDNDPDSDETVQLNFQGGPTSDIDMNNNTKGKENANMDDTVDFDKGYESAETVQLEVSNADNLLEDLTSKISHRNALVLHPKKGLSARRQMKSKSRQGGLTGMMVLTNNVLGLKLGTNGGSVQMS